MHVSCVYIHGTGRFFSRFHHAKVLTYEQIPLGISYISSSLKKAGHTTEMSVFAPDTKAEEFLPDIKKDPSLFVLSVMDKDCVTSHDGYAGVPPLIQLIKSKYPQAKVLLCGTYITLLSQTSCAEDDLKNTGADAICIGDGETAVVEYAGQTEKNSYRKTDNLWIKDNDGKWLKCGKSLFVEDLDGLPYPDMDCWFDKCENFPDLQVKVQMGRGCCNRCIYCVSQVFEKSSEGKYFRIRSAGSIVKEIEYLRDKYKNLDFIILEVENGFFDAETFYSLCKALAAENNKYEKKLKFSLTLAFTPLLMKDNAYIIDMMKQANIVAISFSIESGSLEIRNKLKRPYVTNEQIIEFCKKLYAYGIKTTIAVMYCHPFETLKTYNETIKLLQICKPSRIDKAVMGVIGNTELENLKKEMNFSFPGLFAKMIYLSTEWRVYRKYKSLKEMLFLWSDNKFVYPIVSLWDKMDKYKLKKAETYQIKAKKAFDDKNYKAAVKYFNKIKIGRHNGWIYADRALAKMKIRNYKGAIEDFNKASKFGNKEAYEKLKQECSGMMNQGNV